MLILPTGIFDFIYQHGSFQGVDEEAAVNAIIRPLVKENYNQDQKKTEGLDPMEFHNHELTVEDISMRISMEERAKKVGFYATGKQVANISSSSHFLCIRVKASSIKKTIKKDEYHLLFVDHYDPSNSVFHCLNSWGEQFSTPSIADSDEGLTHVYLITLDIVEEGEMANKK